MQHCIQNKKTINEPAMYVYKCANGQPVAGLKKDETRVIRAPK